MALVMVGVIILGLVGFILNRLAATVEVSSLCAGASVRIESLTHAHRRR